MKHSSGRRARTATENRPARHRLAVVLTTVAAAVAVATTALAGTINGLVKETEGTAVSDAVIFMVPVSGRPAPVKPAARAVMDQQNKEFVPLVLAISVGTEVTFPNKDKIRHSVYSFSPAKKFEVPLYKGKEAAPVKFDKPGVVVLGCNIHDWMLGYIYALETPHFATTGADGRARIADVPAGTYEIRLWHPWLLPGSPPPIQRRTLAAGTDEQAEVEFTVRLQPDPRAGRGPSDIGRPRR